MRVWRQAKRMGNTTRSFAVFGFILFDKTQPIRDRDTPWYNYAPGLFIRQVLGESWEVVDMDGKHKFYMRAEAVEYESTIPIRLTPTGAKS